ncbi:MAG: aminopeptidase [Bacteroidia bacterium]|nr:aminopeptidase [Bacteroidales bacterium]NCD40726.1 aminopeptidase [Bacteroidia bacterium]MDD2323176.1 C1 family peptidase [Bacteroidales bacterium]MDD3010323.1 C1 family peptidase [Bacteroidales bacterium]MDD3961202.1 C1 family peptidase [Bacteroidales bacterium]
MKKGILTLLAILMVAPILFAQEEKKEEKKGYEFTTVKEIPVTPVRDQYRSGTCWSFSGIGMLEAELIRKGKGEIDLSEAFVIRHCFEEKADRYVRWHGNINFGGGGAFHDVTWVWKNFGIVPEEAYQGLPEGEEKFVHGEQEEVLKNYVDGIKENKNRKLTKVWKQGFNGILDAYLGDVPEEFTYKGKKYTPQSFAKDLGLNMDDYVEISSYTHHPFYKPFIIEVPDNWLHDAVYNVPLEEMMQIIDNAINNGYTVGWGADVSDKGFSWKNGVAIIPEKVIEASAGSEVAKWDALTKKEQESKLYTFDGTAIEKEITQELRQEHFDNYLTTDDHGMVLCGIAKDQNGNIYYKVKNSWNVTGNDYEGFFYASKAFVALQTIDIMLHKDAIPTSIKKQLNL